MNASRLLEWIGPESRFWPVIAAALLAGAFWPLLGPGQDGSTSVDSWFFESRNTSTPLVLAIAAWLVWRRGNRYARLEDRCARALAATCLFAAATLFGWARCAGSSEALLLSLVATLLGVASWEKGWPGLRLFGVPVCALLLALPLPPALQNEWVWHLQYWGAQAASKLMALAGLDVGTDGIVIWYEGTTFVVIEACSGMRAMRTLILVSIVVADLFDREGLRRWGLAALALLIGFSINALRIAWIAAAHDPDPSQGHVGQGVLTLLSGTVLLFGADALLWRQAAPESSSGRAQAWPLFARRMCVAAACAALTAVLIPWGAALPNAGAAPSPLTERFPEAKARWSSDPVKSDWLYLEPMPMEQVVHRAYRLQTESEGMSAKVEVLVGLAQAGTAGSLRSPKLELPGRGWTPMEKLRAPAWAVNRKVRVVIAERLGERKLVYSWLDPDRGLLGSSLGALLALDRGILWEPRHRVAVRLSTPIWDHPRAIPRARQRLDLFVREFADELASL